MDIDPDEKFARVRVLASAHQAAEHAKVTNAVYAWIREDVGMAAKLTITPDIAAKLVDRICGSRTHFAEQNHD